MPLTWETKSDWNNHRSQNQVFHEQINGEKSGGNIYLGYPSTSPLSDPYTAYFALNDPAGDSTVADVAGSESLSVEGVALNDVTGPTGLSAPTFDGIDDRLVDQDVTGTYLDVGGASELSLVCWYDWDGSGDDTLLNYDTIPARLTINGNPNLAAKFEDDTGSTFVPFDSAVSDNQWRMAVGTYGPSSAELYRDVTLLDSVSTNGNPLDTASTMRLEIGAAGETGTQWYPGQISQCMIFESQLSSSQIQTLYDVTSRGNLVTAKKTT